MLRSAIVGVYRVYAAAAFVAVVLLLFCPVLIAAPTLRLRREIGRLTVRLWLLSIGVRLTVRGVEHLPRTPCIALCNHASYVDGIVFTAALPARFTFLVQHRAADWPYIGLIIRRMGVRFVNRESVIAAGLAVRRLIRDARDGHSLAIFPEGGFRPDPGLMPFYDGAFRIAARTGLPVVPGVMRGSRRFFGEGQWLPRWSRIEIELFAPVSAADHRRPAVAPLRERAFSTMLRHCGEGRAEVSALPGQRTPPHARPAAAPATPIDTRPSDPDRVPDALAGP